MDQSWDPRGEADAALARIVAGFGPQVLGRADMLEGLLNDDIPQLPREAAMLTAAAQSKVGDLLAERVRHGISPEAAVALVASDMTARTAVDASGAPWAAGVFARALGYQVPGPGTPTVTPPTLPIDQAQPPAPEPAAPTVVMPGGQRGSSGEATILPPADRRPTVRPTAGAGRRLTTATAGAIAVAAPMPLLWCADASSNGVLSGSFFSATDVWLTAVFLVAGLAGIALWSARGPREGTGFAAVAGIAIPATAIAITSTALAAELTDLPGILRNVLLLISACWLAGALTAAVLSIAGLARSRQLARYSPGLLPVLLTAAGVGYALANILAQGQDDGTLLFNALGPGVAGWWILWGVVFIATTSVPPLLTGFLPPGARVAMWTGWLLFALANQLGESPINGITAKPGLYLTWTLWVAVLAGTLVMAARARAAGGQRQAEQI
jgi:hypothetical protein